ncbi:hypothetical protein BOH78_4693, partial [Pichia kudriavzevii]
PDFDSELSPNLTSVALLGLIRVFVV